MEYVITGLLLFALGILYKVNREVGVLKNDVGHIKKRLCGKAQGKEEP
jgi:hypothetical protein